MKFNFETPIKNQLIYTMKFTVNNVKFRAVWYDETLNISYIGLQLVNDPDWNTCVIPDTNKQIGDDVEYVKSLIKLKFVSELKDFVKKMTSVVMNRSVPVAGEVWESYTGGKYMIMGLVKDATNPIAEPEVCYISENNILWRQPLNTFLDTTKDEPFMYKFTRTGTHYEIRYE